MVFMAEMGLTGPERWAPGIAYVIISITSAILGEVWYRRRLERWCVTALTGAYRENALLFIKNEVLLDGRLPKSYTFKTRDLYDKSGVYMLPKELITYILMSLEKAGFIKMCGLYGNGGMERLYFKASSKLVDLATEFHRTVVVYGR